MASQNIARLGVVLGLDSGELVTELDAAQKQFKKFSNEIKRDTNDAAKEIVALEVATKRYGQVLTKEQELQLQFDTGRFKYATETTKKALLEKAKAYDAVAASATKANKAQGNLTPYQQQALMYQTTDTITSLLGGQNPMMVLLQQGGQLKDQFGGLKPMFAGIAAAITPVGVAVTAFTGTVLGLGYAMYQGYEESKKFNASIALTGNYAGMTALQFNALAESIGNKYNVSIGSTKDVMQTLIASGQFTKQSLLSVTELITSFSKISGESATTVADKLIPSMDGTANSAARLNSQYHFLTIEQYKHIEALEKQGKIQESIKFIADAFNDKLKGQESNLGYLEAAWKNVTNAMSGYFNDLKKWGQKDLASEIAEAAIKVTSYTKAWGANNIETIRAIQNRDKLIQQMHDEMNKADEDSKKAAKTQSQIEFEKKYAQQVIDIRAKTADLITKADYETMMKGADKIKQLELQKEMETLLAKEELKRKIAANPQMAKEYQKEYDAKVQEKTANLAKQQADISRDELLKYKEKAVAEQDSLDKEKERLEVYKNNLLASDADLQIALSRLKTQQEIAEIERNTKIEKPEDKKAAEDRLRDIQKSREAVINQAAELKMLQDMNQSVFSNMGSALENFVKTGKLSFKDLTKSIIQDLISIAMRAQMMAMFKGFNFFGGSSTSTGTSYSLTDGQNIGGLGLKLSGQTLAGGGSPQVGMASLVGENGPELFVPNTAGTIIPNGQFGSSMDKTPTVVNNYNINAIDTKSFEDRILGSSKAVWAANKYGEKNLPIGTGRT